MKITANKFVAVTYDLNVGERRRTRIDGKSNS